MDVRKKVFTIEAVKNPTSPLDVPNLHILIEESKKNKGIWIGHCLDLNICAHSNKKKSEEIIHDIFYVITKMAKGMILRFLIKGNIKDLFKCCENNTGKWHIFNKNNNEEKIIKLEKSYKQHIDYIRTYEEVLTTNINKKDANLLKKHLVKVKEDSIRQIISDKFENQPIYDLRRIAA